MAHGWSVNSRARSDRR